MPTVRVAMGVGGAFDFLAGTKKRAPKWMQKTATEWLFRLIQEPKRIKRIYNAVVRFPITIFLKNK
jgi:N-acetylglucosaminyldiphosphoundecaprenol N-acetyl-beta-D-mannosaminyltransferase